MIYVSIHPMKSPDAPGDTNSKYMVKSVPTPVSNVVEDKELLNCA